MEKCGMTLNEYQALAQRTATDGDFAHRLAIAGLGLCGEAGEAAEIIKKHIGHGHPLDPAWLAKELGDVLWYVAEIAKCVGFSLEVVAQLNVEKLKKRYPEGFSEADSIARVDAKADKP